jgi:hypothetical protein
MPEYPQSPAAHLKSPTAINISGRISHCETELRTGQRKAARGYAGLVVADDRELADGATEETSLPLLVFLAFRRGLCGEGEGPAIVT